MDCGGERIGSMISSEESLMSRLVALVSIVAVVVGTALSTQRQSAFAGTTGGVSGRVLDDKGNPVASAHVTATGPSQSATATADAKGFYSILNLAPDTYSVTASKDGFDPSTVNGITVQADQNVAVDVTIKASARVLGHVTTTAAVSVVSKNTTGDLYAVSAQAINKY